MSEQGNCVEHEGCTLYALKPVVVQNRKLITCRINTCMSIMLMLLTMYVHKYKWEKQHSSLKWSSLNLAENQVEHLNLKISLVRFE